MSTFFLIFIPRLGSPLSCWLRPDYSWHFVTSEETFLASDVSHHEENSFWNYFLNNKHNTCRPANILHLVPFASFLFSSISHETRIYKFIRRRFMAAHSPDCHIMNLSCVNGKRTSCLFDFSRFRKKTVPIVRLSIPYECRPDIRNTTCKHTWMKNKKKFTHNSDIGRKQKYRVFHSTTSCVYPGENSRRHRRHDSSWAGNWTDMLSHPLRANFHETLMQMNLL